MSLTVFDQDLALSTSGRIWGHDRRYLDVIGVAELNHVFINKIEVADMHRISAMLRNVTEPRRVFKEPIWLFIYTSSNKGSMSRISLDETHAFSVFQPHSEGLLHAYFERSGRVFREVRAQRRAISAVPDLDDIRLLHFAGFGLGRLPNRSTIFEFKAKTWGVEQRLRTRDTRLRIALLIDNDRIAGAPTMGLYGSEVFTALLDEGGGEGGHCGNAETCPLGEQGCVPVPPEFSAGYTCGDEVNTGDGWISVFVRAIREGLISIDDADFLLLRTVTTELLPQSLRGREYLSYYYILSTALRHDDQALREFVDALPYLRAFLRAIQAGDNEAVAVTPELRDATKRLIASHRKVNSRIFQRVLDIIERDIEAVVGMSRANVLDILQSGEERETGLRDLQSSEESGEDDA